MIFYVRKILGMSVALSLLICNAACRRPGKKVMSRFKNGDVAVVHEFTDVSDTSTYTYWEYYPNGKVHQRVAVVRDSVVGTPTTYYMSGNVYTIDSLYHPRPRFSESWDGIVKRFYENGNIAGQFQVKNGVIQGETEIFDSHGLLLKKYNVIKDSIKNGPYVEYYPNGAVSVRAFFENGILNGKMYYFRPNGDTLKYYTRDSGDISFPYKKWLDSGNVLIGNYTGKGRKYVRWEWYDKNGKKIKDKVQLLENQDITVPE